MHFFAIAANERLQRAQRPKVKCLGCAALLPVVSCPSSLRSHRSVALQLCEACSRLAGKGRASDCTSLEVGLSEGTGDGSELYSVTAGPGGGICSDLSEWDEPVRGVVGPVAYLPLAFFDERGHGSGSAASSFPWPAGNGHGLVGTVSAASGVEGYCFGIGSQVMFPS